jgi:hypothetical protein
MTNYYKVLVHSSTADIEKYKGLKRNAVYDINEWAENEGKVSEKPGLMTKQESDENMRLYNKSQDSMKALANHEWYMRNKQWKKEYNAEYYQKNKEYWEKRMNEDMNKHHDNIDKGVSETATGEQVWANATASKINHERAQKEYDDFMSRTQVASTPVSSCQLPERKSLIDRGVNVLHKVLTPILGVLVKLLS